MVSKGLLLNGKGIMSKETYRRFDPWRTTPVKEESRQAVISGHYFDIDQVSFNSYDVGHFDRYILHKNNGDSVGVIALTDDGLIPLIEQYRVAVHRWTLEIPAGHAILPDERPLEVAQRKLKEEVGYEAKEYKQFCRFVNTPSYSDQYTELFFASGLTQIQDTPNEDNLRTHVRYYTPQEAYNLVLNGTIIDAKSIIAITRMYFAPDYHVDDSQNSDV